MKKLIFGFIATIMVTTLSFGQSIGLDYFAKLDPIKTAQIHNEVVSGIIKLQKEDPKLSIKDALLKININLSTDDKLAIYDYISENYIAEQNFKKLILNLKSEKAKVIYTNINSLINNYADYNSLIKTIDDELLIANKELTGFDLKVIQLFAETSKASANYWHNQYSSNSSTNRAKWITKDGNGIAQASVGWAIGAAFCGGGPASYFIACGVGGALASIWPD
jgi:hypothetical protein